MRWRKGRASAENDAGWTTLSESTMGTILRLVGRHLPLTTTRHLQKLTRMSGWEVATATEHSANFSGFFEKTRSMDGMSPIDCGLTRQVTHLGLISAIFLVYKQLLWYCKYYGNNVQIVEILDIKSTFIYCKCNIWNKILGLPFTVRRTHLKQKMAFCYFTIRKTSGIAYAAY